MQDIIQYIFDHAEAIFGSIGIAVALVIMGRKRAITLIMGYLETAKEDFLQHIEDHAQAFAKYIYAKLPASAKAFVSIKMIERLIVKFALEIQALDKESK